MIGYPIETNEKEAKASGIGLPISTKSSVIVCRKINRLKLEKAKKFLKNLTDKKADINGKHFTKVSGKILEVLETAEKNANYRGLENLRIKIISAEKGPRFRRRKRRWSFGSIIKNTHIKVVLEEVKK